MVLIILVPVFLTVNCTGSVDSGIRLYKSVSADASNATFGSEPEANLILEIGFCSRIDR